MDWIPSWQQEGAWRQCLRLQRGEFRVWNWCQVWRAVGDGCLIGEGRSGHKLVFDTCRSVSVGSGYLGGLQSSWLELLPWGLWLGREARRDPGPWGGSCRCSSCLSGYLPLCSQLSQPPLQQNHPCVGWLDEVGAKVTWKPIPIFINIKKKKIWFFFS